MTARARGGDAGHRASEFLRIAHLYRLGILPTEQPHPLTRDLSGWARADLPRAIAALKEIDLQALRALQGHAPHIDRLGLRVDETLQAGRRIYLCGCGATGRLALSLEFLWREARPDDDRVISFMAGGDVALVHALEGFEDHASYGARHLEEMGFDDGDLLIACTEGGETPYVIGATQRASQISSRAPCFLYCNDDATLARHVERFRGVQENPRIDRFCLEVGPMALAGSTRMQASTVLQLAVGLALLHRGARASEAIAGFTRAVGDTDMSFLAGFIAKEAGIYAMGDRVTYRVSDFGITVLTDTTERAPTFSLAPFDRLRAGRAGASLCHLCLDDAGDPDDAWARLLGRAPRALNWPEIDPRTLPGYLRDFDFSAEAARRRRRLIPDRTHHEFRIRRGPRGIRLGMDDLAQDAATDGQPALFQHLLLKQMLNIHSTLVMGRLGRFEGNLMTWVSPTNGKLVDRAARYVAHLLERDGGAGCGYEEIVRALFAEMDRAVPGESVVLRTCRSLRRRRAAS